MGSFAVIGQTTDLFGIEPNRGWVRLFSSAGDLLDTLTSFPYPPKSCRPWRGGIGIRLGGLSGGARLGSSALATPPPRPPAADARFAAACLMASNTFLTDTGSITTEIMCLRPPQFGQRRTSSENTLSNSFAQGM